MYNSYTYILCTYILTCIYINGIECVYLCVCVCVCLSVCVRTTRTTVKIC